MEKNITQKVVAGGILINKGRILLLKRSATESVYPNMWELPSGKKESGETVQQTMVREFKEETGLKVSCLEPISVFDYTLKKGELIKETTQINFLVKLTNNQAKIKLSSEHDEFGWFNLQDLKNLYISKNTKSIIQKYMRKK